jgi:hypothetical protein
VRRSCDAEKSKLRFDGKSKLRFDGNDCAWKKCKRGYGRIWRSVCLAGVWSQAFGSVLVRSGRNLAPVAVLGFVSTRKSGARATEAEQASAKIILQQTVLLFNISKFHSRHLWRVMRSAVTPIIPSFLAWSTFQIILFLSPYRPIQFTRHLFRALVPYCSVCSAYSVVKLPNINQLMSTCEYQGEAVGEFSISIANLIGVEQHLQIKIVFMKRLRAD